MAISKIEDLQAEQIAVHEKMAAIVDIAKTGERGFTDDERTQLGTLKDRHSELTAKISQQQEDDSFAGFVASQAASTRVTLPDPVSDSRENSADDPKRGFRTPREFLTAAMAAGQSGKMDPRLKSLAVGSDEASTVADPYGGFLLPEGFSPNVLSIMAEGDPTAGRTTAIPMTTQIVALPARVDKTHTSSVSGGLQVYRRGETDTSAATRAEYEQVKLEATGLFGIAYATEELLARSAVSFAALLSAGFSSEFSAKILKEKLFGTGAGQMTGVVNAACTVSQAKETGQNAATIVYENVINMRSRVWGYGGAVWLANHDCLPQLMLMNHSVGTGGVPVWQPSAREDHPDTLLGRPLFFTEFAKTIGTLGDLVCGNWSQYLEGTLTGPQQAESVHVRFINHERTFKFWMENDGKPWWTAALTPNQSTTTLSPFVTLAARA